MENKVILVLEDETPLLNAIKKKLEKSNCHVVTARTVKQGLAYVKDLEKIDAIWLDHYLLGKEDGLDFVAQIKREDSVWKEIPIFVVSNTATTDKINTYIEFGVNKYFTKADNRLDDIIGEIKKRITTNKAE